MTRQSIGQPGGQDEIYHLMIGEVEDYAILMLDPQGHVVSWNRGAEKIKGYREEEILGKHFSIFYPENDQPHLPNTLIAIAGAKGKATHEGWRVRKDGTRFWGSIVITAIHNEANELIGFCKVTRDLTERKAAEDKLLQYAHRLETQNTELQQFAYAAAHDLKEPLRKIMMYYSAISGEGVASLSAKQQQYLSRSANAAARMHGLIDDMLAFTRLTQPGQVLEPVDLDSLLTEIVESLKDNIDAAGARISIAPLSSVMGIPFQLRQVFINLLGNALKYHHPDRLPSIDLFAQTLEKEAGNGTQRQIFHRITIRDNGIGFDEDQRERIFNLFERLHGRNEFEGTGIGLAICRKIMQTHQGAVTATGKIGLGAEFHLDFPSDIT